MIVTLSKKCLALMSRIVDVGKMLESYRNMDMGSMAGIWTKPSLETSILVISLYNDLPEHYVAEYMFPTENNGVFISTNLDATSITVNGNSEPAYKFNAYLNNGCEEPIPFEAQFPLKSKDSMIHLINILAENNLTSE